MITRQPWQMYRKLVSTGRGPGPRPFSTVYRSSWGGPLNRFHGLSTTYSRLRAHPGLNAVDPHAYNEEAGGGRRWHINKWQSWTRVITVSTIDTKLSKGF